MKALVLAAGFGKRLLPLTLTTPKPLITVHSIPLILYNLALLKANGIHDVVINLHHLGHHIQKFLGRGHAFDMNIIYSHEKKILGTGGGIKKAARYFDDDILILNGDVICDIPLKKLMAQHHHSQNAATLVLRQHRDSKKFGRLGFNDNNLTSILNEPLPSKKTKFGHFTGVHILRKKMLKTLLTHQEYCIIRDVYMPALLQGEKFGAFVTQDFWSDCGTFESIKKTTTALKNTINLSYQKQLDKILTALSKSK